MVTSYLSHSSLCKELVGASATYVIICLWQDLGIKERSSTSMTFIGSGNLKSDGQLKSRQLI